MKHGTTVSIYDSEDLIDGLRNAKSRKCFKALFKLSGICNNYLLRSSYFILMDICRCVHDIQELNGGTKKSRYII